MYLTFLGTGAGSPSLHRNVSSLLLSLQDVCGESWLFDCGEATQHQILRSSIKLRKISRIFITHLHGDHIFGLLGLLSSRDHQGGQCTKLIIYSPPGIREFVQTSFRISDTQIHYPIDFVEFRSGDTLVEDENFKVICLKLDHAIDSFGFRIVQRDIAGSLNVEKLLGLGLSPSPLFARIKAGEDFEFEGKSYSASEFINQPKAGRIISILGDSRPCENILYLAENADLFVHEATILRKEDSPDILNYGHSTAIDAVSIAARSGVKKIVMNHISSRYTQNTIRRFCTDLRSKYPSLEIYFSSDFDEFKI